MRPFSIGSVLGRSFAIWGANFLAFFIISAIVHLPELIFNYAALNGHVEMQPNTIVSLNFLLSTIFGLVGTGALAFGVFAQLRGEHASVGRCISVGLSRLPTLLWLAFLLFLIFLGIGLVVVFGGGIVGGVFGIIFVMGLLLVGGMYLIGLVVGGLPPTVAWLVGSIYAIAWGSLSSTACAVTYHDLREIKEGVGVDQLSAVFE
jgi:hypothetical protein